MIQEEILNKVSGMGVENATMKKLILTLSVVAVAFALQAGEGACPKDKAGCGKDKAGCCEKGKADSKGCCPATKKKA